MLEFALDQNLYPKYPKATPSDESVRIMRIDFNPWIFLNEFISVHRHGNLREKRWNIVFDMKALHDNPLDFQVKMEVEI